jgi:hypothetical protein
VSIWLHAVRDPCTNPRNNHSADSHRHQQVSRVCRIHTGLLSVNVHQLALCQLHRFIGAQLPCWICRLHNRQPHRSTRTVNRAHNIGACYSGANCSTAMFLLHSRRRLLPRCTIGHKLCLRGCQRNRRVVSNWLHAVREPSSNARDDSLANTRRHQQVSRVCRIHTGFLSVDVDQLALCQLHRSIGALVSCWICRLRNRQSHRSTRAIDNSTDSSDHLFVLHRRNWLVPRCICCNELCLRVSQHHRRVVSNWLHAVRDPCSNARNNRSTNTRRRQQVLRVC